MLAHKGTEAFSVGVQFAAEGVPLTQVVTIMLLYCAMTPLGVFVGMAELLVRGTTGRIVESITQAFGAGEGARVTNGAGRIVRMKRDLCSCCGLCLEAWLVERFSGHEPAGRLTGFRLGVSRSCEVD